MSIGAQKNVKLIDQLRTKIASSISQLNVEDPNETTPPSVSAEQPTVAPGQMTPTTSEKKPNVGMESMPANGDAQDEVATDQMKLASKASRIVDMLARIKKASNEEAATANGGEALAPKPVDGNAQEEDTMADGEAAPKPNGDVAVEEAKEANTELDVAALISFMDRSALSKLAYVVLSNDKVAGDLIQDVESLTEKSAALRLLDDALEASEAEYYEKSAALEIENALGARINRMDRNEVEHLTKAAAFHQQFLDKELSTDMLKQAYVEGADAADMAEQGEGELPLPAEESPASIEEVAGALEEMVQDGEITPEQAEEILVPLAEEASAGEGAADVGPEEVVQALDEMVQSGEISEEEAIAVAEEVLAPDMEGAEAAPAEAPVEAAPMEEVKAAARRFVRKQAMTKEVPVEEDDEYGDYAEGLPSDEEILAILGEMVDSGEISEEEAIAIVEEAAAGGEAPAEEPVEEAPEEEVKEAAAEEAMGGELPSDEEVVEALGEMVESGEISEEEAMALLEESAAGGEAPTEEEVKEAAAEEAMGGELPSDEEVLEALGEMVESGEISEDEAIAIVEEAAAGGEEAPVEGGEAASDEEVVEALGEMVESGEISEEEAMALLEESAA